MSRRGRWVDGANLSACQRCGSVYRSNQLVEDYQGLLVCTGPGTFECFEERHPTDYLRSIPDNFAVQNIRTRNKTTVQDVYSFLIDESSNLFVDESGNNLIDENRR